MNVILSEKFGLYEIEVREDGTEFRWRINYLDEDGGEFGSESNGLPYPRAYKALQAGLARLAGLFNEDGLDEEKAGNGIRTRDILLGNFPINSDPAPEVEK